VSSTWTTLPIAATPLSITAPSSTLIIRLGVGFDDSPGDGSFRKGGALSLQWDKWKRSNTQASLANQWRTRPRPVSSSEFGNRDLVQLSSTRKKTFNLAHLAIYLPFSQDQFRDLASAYCSSHILFYTTPLYLNSRLPIWQL
jgi:hypothetical protein